ncbi:ankyrin repeat domain-containing protein EMB506, chloroplastic isoform X1 [Selaginella moellendorffii]|uniref:ankyrin repeat domain-containing protein EMB506, chloroplastic isoform X1 n=1 Tax=Selaginella moellendorffii TaxID=88036 RepID=UPI000D1C7E93|nr:ankyrin repeat domain-containing protein EMB506, chloroplastic isoform X1 [Selaginella moellendorffii]|eukprot:XP_002967108.2 ankyrin repeat domain-containing protein EMB506, chloroplastic isoform X1 [Selaginella moellendorffii]
MPLVACGVWLPGSDAAVIRQQQSVDRKKCGRAMRMLAEISLWRDEEAADGKDAEVEEGIFESVVKRPAAAPPLGARTRFVAQVPVRGLVPERWRDLQDDLNRTKRQKRREVLKGRRSRSKEEKAKLREKLGEIIDEAIQQEKIEEEEEEEEEEVAHTVFEGGRQLHRASYRHEELSDDLELGDDNGGELVSAERSQNLDNCGKATRKNSKQAKKVTEPAPPNYSKGENLKGNERKLFQECDRRTIEKRSCEKWMPLHTLASPQQPFLVAELMQQDDHEDNVNEEGVTVLRKAVQAGRLHIVKHLIHGGANVFYRDKDGSTLLHHAVASGSPSVVRLLLKYGVHVNSVDKAGWTPLHVAVCCQQRDILRVLLNRGADWTIANEDGDTPLDLSGNGTSGLDGKSG